MYPFTKELTPSETNEAIRRLSLKGKLIVFSFPIILLLFGVILFFSIRQEQPMKATFHDQIIGGLIMEKYFVKDHGDDFEVKLPNISFQ